ncbi:MAG: tRNA (adenosine(37)-N6)-threonylcarbamoyltransferase complex dimerization subunit type 1 TsaB [Candidatus Nanopelagicales bacterium]|nr:tRNA (adenosine(37)-N6)-threonylcarbamoyltransferase complex dimerization subunit type 1 TsaB [Candidatus Nanopelagicales bacterium]MDZ4248544.1 tRNA (adenosine(37)-N6)-threonylcarbamoyltransferase complex dimerization subunit type 1 TsaB [Candidatus Nanopelagicales bacterium]
MILAIDTSGSLAAVAVHDGSEVVFAGSGTRVRAHGEELGPLLAEAMSGRTRRFTHVVVGRGPGLYTGLRVGLAAASSIGWALDLPVLGFCSLDVLADQFDGGLGGCAVVVDARRRELFWARYADGRRISGPDVGKADEVRAEIGAGVPVYGDTGLLDGVASGERGSVRIDPGALGRFAAQLVALGRGEPPVPIYLRSPDVTASAGAKSALPGGS